MKKAQYGYIPKMWPYVANQVVDELKQCCALEHERTAGTFAMIAKLFRSSTESHRQLPLLQSTTSKYLKLLVNICVVYCTGNHPRQEPSCWEEGLKKKTQKEEGSCCRMEQWWQTTTSANWSPGSGQSVVGTASRHHRAQACNYHCALFLFFHPLWALKRTLASVTHWYPLSLIFQQWA